MIQILAQYDFCHANKIESLSSFSFHTSFQAQSSSNTKLNKFNPLIFYFLQF
jgi:hypothetical protein